MNTKKFSLLSIPITATNEVLQKFPFPIDLTRGSYLDIAISIKDFKTSITCNNKEIKDFSFVWLISGWTNRDLAYAFHLYLTKANTPHTPTEHACSKITDMVTFALNNLPVPDSLYINRSSVADKIDMIENICGFPLIIKDIKGSGGKDSLYVSNKDSLMKALETLPQAKRFVFQKFIPNEYDWGIMVANGVVVSGEKSYPAEGAFLNNAINGAREEFISVDEIPQHLKDMAIKSSALLGLSWARADITIDKETEDAFLLEVNRYPGITKGSDEVGGAYTFLNSQISKIAA